jgi:ubiquinone/menaquinone biosynthesis C-methylase UbiE
MEHAHRPYLPAAGRDWALPLYDPFVTLIGADARRQTLIDQAALEPHHRVLDVGCGTGSLIVQIKRGDPAMDVTGLDPDPNALARAQQKARRASVAVGLDVGFADRLPYADSSFDRVFSSFMFHHLPSSDRLAMLREVRRTLKPGGSLHLVDFDGFHHRIAKVTRLFDSGRHLSGMDEQHLLALMREAGLQARKAGESAVALGLLRISYYQALA